MITYAVWTKMISISDIHIFLSGLKTYYDCRFYKTKRIWGEVTEEEREKKVKEESERIKLLSIKMNDMQNKNIIHN